MFLLRLAVAPHAERPLSALKRRDLLKVTSQELEGYCKKLTKIGKYWADLKIAGKEWGFELIYCNLSPTIGLIFTDLRC